MISHKKLEAPSHTLPPISVINCQQCFSGFCVGETGQTLYKIFFSGRFDYIDWAISVNLGFQTVELLANSLSLGNKN